MTEYDLTNGDNEPNFQAKCVRDIERVLSWLVERRFATVNKPETCLYMAGYKDALDELSELLDQGYIE